ncbi:hypothetical protein GRF29_1g1295895 [Pseudopithomyces chartarum]|uniref:Uncharacterized protein n=1 Tax=Pseudopithomyces chartarum TaxID=1892770 RepID=A0AAN6RM27_9PLEO|nr:hypothetical protein GRF29_1g1295895 [Pseudopithomyces chartarum]
MCSFWDFTFEECKKNWTEETTLEEKLKHTLRFKRFPCTEKNCPDDGKRRIGSLEFWGSCPKCEGKEHNHTKELEEFRKSDSEEEAEKEEKEFNAKHKPESAGSA